MSLIIDLTELRGFVSIDSKKIKITETITSKNKENLTNKEHQLINEEINLNERF